MMNVKGYQLFWTIPTDMECPPTMADHFFGDKVKVSNDKPAALTKAVRAITREMLTSAGLHDRSFETVEKSLRGRSVKYRDQEYRAYAIVKPKVIDEKPVFPIVCDVRVRKDGIGGLSFDSSKKDPSVTMEEFEAIAQSIQAKWEHGRENLGREQIASLVKRAVRRLCHGTTLNNGGVFFVSKAHSGNLDVLKAFFDALGGNCRLTITTVYDDTTWNEAVSEGAAYDVQKEIDKFVNKLKEEMTGKETLEQKMIDNRVETAKRLKDLVEIQKESLWQKAEEFEAQSDAIVRTIDETIRYARTLVDFDIETAIQNMIDRE